MDQATCPFCRAPSPVLFRVGDLNRRLSDEVFSYYECPQCHLIFLHPQPTDLGSYYPQEYYGDTRSLADLEKEYAFNRYKVDIVRQFTTRGRLLEVGPSRGTFAYLAKEAGFQVTVIERDEECCRFLKEVTHIDALHSADPVAALRQQTQPYDVIALWQVIEHLNDPWDFFRTAVDKLAPGGILVLATPNPAALQFKIFGRCWFHLDAPRHLQIIPAGLLTDLGASLGLHVWLLTAADADAPRHNLASWQISAANAYPWRRGRGILARWMGRLGNALRPCERAGFRGSTYTLVLRKPA